MMWHRGVCLVMILGVLQPADALEGKKVAIEQMAVHRSESSRGSEDQCDPKMKKIYDGTFETCCCGQRWNYTDEKFEETCSEEQKHIQCECAADDCSAKCKRTCTKFEGLFGKCATFKDADEKSLTRCKADNCDWSVKDEKINGVDVLGHFEDEAACKACKYASFFDRSKRKVEFTFTKKDFKLSSDICNKLKEPIRNGSDEFDKVAELLYVNKDTATTAVALQFDGVDDDKEEDWKACLTSCKCKTKDDTNDNTSNCKVVTNMGTTSTSTYKFLMCFSSEDKCNKAPDTWGTCGESSQIQFDTSMTTDKEKVQQPWEAEENDDNPCYLKEKTADDGKGCEDECRAMKKRERACETKDCGSSCFAAGAMIETDQGRSQIENLAVGNNVRTASGTFEQVTGFIHADDNTMSEFLEIKHQVGVLKVSKTHLLFRADGSDVQAGEVLVGDVLTTVGKSSRVLSIKQTMSKGFYAPVTASGTIVADGVVASTYAVPSRGHWLAHLMISPLQALTTAPATPKVGSVFVAPSS